MNTKHIKKYATIYAKIPLWIKFISIILAVLLIMVIYPIILAMHIPTLEQRGFWGDSFGLISTLFSGLAFAGIILSIIVQGKELKRQGNALEIQSTALKYQLEIMSRTEKINSLAALINAEDAYYNAISGNARYMIKSMELTKRIEDNCGKLEKLLSEIETENNVTVSDSI